MKIALVTNGIYPYVMGGMQKHSYNLVKTLARKGTQVDLYHFIPKGKEHLENPFTEEERGNINEIIIDYPIVRWFPGHYLWTLYLYSKLIFKEFLKRRPVDFVYAKGFSGWHFLRMKRKGLLEIPFGVNFHGYEMFQKWPSFKVGLKLQLLKLPVLEHIKHSDYLFSYGGKITTIIERLGGRGKIIDIPTGINQDWINTSDDLRNFGKDRVKFIFVGRAERRKGIQEIKEVLRTLPENQFEFHFVGPIPESQQVSGEHIFYHGPKYDQSEIKNILRTCDVLVCPSYSEGMPNVIMEGMSQGLAIIATDVGAVAAMVGLENGKLLSPNAITRDLRKSMLEIIERDKRSLADLKGASLEKVRQLSWEKIGLMTIDCLKSCISVKNEMSA
ncbi:hypothetical protein FUAX_24870 [Fulvitalea axinellae]|uniref:Glycosyltransferase subfamily 4-like N-terminal domain-containing protein n=1 Tax=Fulvitalea axinellae TaxID=1182444 RepID=A0AAU9CL67_9BACT|nr:hypothetical protein FUAX_24870 [Fulvitalea axinellae]